MNHSRSYRRHRGFKKGRVRRRGVAGAVVRGVGFLGLIALCVFASRWVRDEVQSSAVLDEPAHGSGFTVRALTVPTVHSRNRRLVYPYSVIPGGVRSAEELRGAAQHDPLVAAHYSGFDYKSAHIIEVSQPKLVYLSYRRAGHIFWTSKQASLHVGEKLLTDGHITARTRCGNQVSVLPQSNTSPQEPPVAELDRPDVLASGDEPEFPEDFESPVLADNGKPNNGPSGLPGNTFAGGAPPIAFMPMPIGVPGGLPACDPKKESKPSKNCSPPPPPPPPLPPPTPVPEPATWLMVGSGAAALLAGLRHKLR